MAFAERRYTDFAHPEAADGIDRRTWGHGFARIGRERVAVRQIARRDRVQCADYMDRKNRRQERAGGRALRPGVGQ